MSEVLDDNEIALLATPLVLTTEQEKIKEAYGYNKRGSLWVMGDKVCHWCKQPTSFTSSLVPWQCTIDHVIPRGDGGRDLHHNIVTACLACNRRRNWEWCAKKEEGAWLHKMPHLIDGIEGRGFMPNGQIPNSTLSTKAYRPAPPPATWTPPKDKIVKDSIHIEQRDQALAELRRTRLLYEGSQAALMVARRELESLTVRRTMVRRALHHLRKWVKLLEALK